MVDTAWNVLSYTNDVQVVENVLASTQLTVRFDTEGRVTGSAGCNNYFAGYETHDETITIGPPGATRRFCAEPQGIMKQEADFLAALHSAVAFRSSGSSHNLYDVDGTMILTLVHEQ
jgi:heat shock protein HslJ